MIVLTSFMELINDRTTDVSTLCLASQAGGKLPMKDVHCARLVVHVELRSSSPVTTFKEDRFCSYESLESNVRPNGMCLGRWFEEHHPEQGNFTHESDRDAIRAVLAKQVGHFAHVIWYLVSWERRSWEKCRCV